MREPEFWPKDSANTLYIADHGSYVLQELGDKAKEKWPGIRDEELRIEMDRIHTHCVSYDLYDPTDWTNFFCITATPAYFERVKP